MSFTHLYKRHLTPVSWCVYKGSKNPARHFVSTVGETHGKSSKNTNQVSGIKIIKAVQPALCPLWCDWQAQPCYQQAWVPVTSGFYYLSRCTRWAAWHPSRTTGLSAELKKKTKNTRTLELATYCGAIFKCQMVKHIMLRLKHVEQNRFGGLHFLIQQLSPRFTDLWKK